VLISAVSLESRMCHSCRWEGREELGPAALRMMGVSYQLKAQQLRGAGNLPAAQDYESEAQSLIAVSLARQAPHA
jgi:hypothetical protein